VHGTAETAQVGAAQTRRIVAAEAGSMTAGKPTLGPAADKGAEYETDTGNAVETLETRTAVESGPNSAEGPEGPAN